MGKKKAAQAAPKKILAHRPLVETYDGGIYLHARAVGKELVELTQAEFRQLSEQSTDAAQLDRELQAVRGYAAGVIKPHLTPIDRAEKALDDVPYTEASRVLMGYAMRESERQADGTTIWKRGYSNIVAMKVGHQLQTLVDLGDGPRWYSYEPNQPSGRAQLALNALREIEEMKAGGDAATHHAYRLGRIIEKLIVMEHEPAALKGKQQAQRAVTAGKTRQLLTDEQRLQAADEIVALVAEGKSRAAACRMLMPKYGVSADTLKRCLARATV